MADLAAVILAELSRGLDEAGVEMEAQYQVVLATRIAKKVEENR